MERHRNPLTEPLVIAFLATLAALLILVAMVIYRLNAPGEKGVPEFSMYSALFGTFTAVLGALGQALSRDPATARANAQAAAANAETIKAATPNNVVVTNPPTNPANVQEAQPNVDPPRDDPPPRP